MRGRPHCPPVIPQRGGCPADCPCGPGRVRHAQVRSAAVSEVECPGCGAVYEFLQVQKSAEEFCPGCDYPLFWAARRDPLSGQSALSVEDGLGPTLRRRPGAAGLQLAAGMACPSCREINPPGTVNCLRCGALMEPVPARPAPVVVAPPPPPPAPPPAPPAPPRRSLLPIVIAVLAVVLAVQILILLLR